MTPASLGDTTDTAETPAEPHPTNKPLLRDQSKDNDTTSPEPAGAAALSPGKIIGATRLNPHLTLFVLKYLI